MNIRHILRGLGGWCRRNAGRLMAGGAIGAEILGFWFMHKEAPIVRDRIEELPEGAKWIDKAKVAGKVYLPAIGMLVLSSGCIIGSVAAGERKAAIFSGLYTASEAALRKYEEIAIEKLGKEKVEELHQQAQEEVIAENPPTAEIIYSTGKGNALIYDPLSGRYFTSSINAIKAAENKINKTLLTEMWQSVNDWYWELELDPIELGDYVGFNIDNNVKVTFKTQTTPDQRPCFVMVYERGHRPVTHRGERHYD